MQQYNYANTFFENSSLQNARASSKLNPTPYIIKNPTKFIIYIIDKIMNKQKITRKSFRM